MSESKKVIDCPKVIGKWDGGFDERSTTSHLFSITEGFAESGSDDSGFETTAAMVVDVFKSDGDGGRGGMVIRLRTDSENDWFKPCAEDLEKGDGVEIHIAGSIESANLVHALGRALLKIDPSIADKD